MRFAPPVRNYLKPIPEPNHYESVRVVIFHHPNWNFTFRTIAVHLYNSSTHIGTPTALAFDVENRRLDVSDAGPSGPLLTASNYCTWQGFADVSSDLSLPIVTFAS
jgi:hypothetical protein